MIGALTLWPGQASAHAASLDRLFWSFTALTFLLTAPVFVAIVSFAVIYRRGRTANRVHPVDRNAWAETSWALIPFALILVFYVWALRLYIDLQQPPANAIGVDVVAKRWMWKTQHAGGQREIDELHVPVGQPVRLTMTSQDVIHSLYFPALRIKQDVLPGRYSSLWFTADREGVYRLACAEFCGTDHSAMVGRLVVMSARDFQKWLARAPVDDTLAQEGEAVYRRAGCGGCHGAGSAARAPALEGLYGAPVPLSSGEIVTADEQYLHDSIVLPKSQIVAGYEPLMPSFATALSDGEIVRLVAYLKSLGPARRENAP